MRIVDHEIKCASRSDRVEIFPFFDQHIGKNNCAEGEIRKQVAEIVSRSKKPGRHVRVLYGGDQINAINPCDLRRFDFSELADWFLQPEKGNKEKPHEYIQRMLNDTAEQEIKRFCKIHKPLKDLIIGAIYGNHEKSMRTKQNRDVHTAICNKMKMEDLTDEAFIRMKFKRGSSVSTVKLYLRHGYGGGRSAGAEPNKLQRMLDEWEDADVCLSGHSHTYCILPAKPVLWVPNRGEYPNHKFLYRYRFAANPGCWLHSHMPGPGSYESMAAYPARPMMTLKVVIWPFWNTSVSKDGKKKNVDMPKIELRSYSIL